MAFGPYVRLMRIQELTNRLGLYLIEISSERQVMNVEHKKFSGSNYEQNSDENIDESLSLTCLIKIDKC